MSDQLLPSNFDAVAQLAASEVYIRGVGAKREYDYSVHDVVAVAWAWDAWQNGRSTQRPCDDTIKALTKRKQAQRLHQVYLRYIESMAR